MRIRSAAAASLLALALLAACSDDDDSAVSTDDAEDITVDEESTDDEATVDDEETESGDSASDDDAGADVDVESLQASVDAAQLETSDLGDGWVLTGTKPAGEDDDEPSPLDDCLAGDIDERVEEGTVAESEERTFELQGETAFPTEITSSSIALEDETLFDEMHELLRSDELATCISDSFREAMASSADGAEITIGDFEATEDVVDPDAAPDLESTGFEIPLTITAEGFTADATVSMTFISTGQLGSSILVFGPSEELRTSMVAELGAILAERLAG